MFETAIAFLMRDVAKHYIIVTLIEDLTVLSTENPIMHSDAQS